jgi:hypothetical protein
MSNLLKPWMLSVAEGVRKRDIHIMTLESMMKQMEEINNANIKKE